MNSYTHALTKDQATELRALLEELEFDFSPKQYTLFFAQKNRLSVAVYEKGPKVLVQGRCVEEFVQFELEPKILGEAKLGYEEVHSPEIFEPHIGVDESGKGDFFGPLVIAGAYVDRGIARKLLDASVVDSKRIGSDARIRALADTIRKSSLGLVEIVLIGPAKYNELYDKFGNLNRLLGWGHARVIENLLAKKPECPRSLSDQFADARVITASLLKHGRKIAIEQRPRAESDIAVAAASILAREAFINWLDRKSKELGLRLQRGVSPGVKESARKLVEMNGPGALREVAKVHFRTAHETAPDHYPAPPPRENWAGPILARRRGGIVIRRGLVRGAKMHFCHLTQCAWPVHFHQLSGALFYARRYSALQSQAELFAFAVQPVDERLARNDRSRRDRNVRFGSRTLFDGNLAPVL